MSVLLDLKTLLDSESVGPAFIGRRLDPPEQPDAGIWLQTYVGDPNRLLDGDNLPADERLAVQVMARAQQHDQFAAETLAHQAFRALSTRHVSVNGREYAWVRANHYPAYIGVDENDRPLVVCNFTARRRGLTP